MTYGVTVISSDAGSAIFNAASLAILTDAPRRRQVGQQLIVHQSVLSAAANLVRLARCSAG